MKVTAIFQSRVLHLVPMRSILSSLCAVVILLALTQHALAAAPALPVISNQTFAVTNAAYGAVGDGATDNTIAIQSAINDASDNGGGTVLIPAAGTLSTYLSGPLTLASGINLQIDGGATLKALPLATFTNYPAQNLTFPDLIYAKNMTDIEISGTGTIDGQGAGWWTAPSSVFNNRPYMIFFNGGCQRVWVHGVTLQNPMKMHVVFKGTDSDITFNDMTINTTDDIAANTDGIDLVGTHCLIQNCTINSGDDNVAIGSSTASAVSTDILITNCTFGVGHGVSIGSNTAGGVSNMTVVACTFDGTDYGIRMKSDNKTSGGSGQGGVAQNLTYSDITMTNIIYGAIVLYSYYSEFGTPTTISPSTAAAQTVGAVLTPVWRNITFSNVSAVVTGRIAGIIWGRREVPFTNVVLQSVNITAPSTFDIYNARGIQIIDSQVTVPGTTNMFNFYDAEVSVTNSVFNTNLVRVGGLAIPSATPPTNCVLSFFNANAMVAETNLLGSGSVTLSGSTLKFRQLLANALSNTLNILGASTLSFTNGTNLFSGTVSGSAPVTLDLPPNTALTPQLNLAAFTDALIVSNSGTLLINNSGGTSTNPIFVLAGTTLAGSGVIAGPVTVDGTLAPGNSPGTLTISNNLILHAGATLQYDLGTASDLTVLTGDLTIDGTLNITDAGGFAANTFSLFTYAGSLSGSAPTIGSVPDSNLVYQIDTDTAGVVKLVVSEPPPVAGFDTSETIGIAPFTVTFTDTSTGSITGRFWDFGDGATSNTDETVLQHTYTSGGTNLVQLIVSGPGGTSTNTVLILIAPPCNFPLSTNSASFGAAGGANSVTVAPYTNVCAWTATSDDAWIQITGGDVTATGAAVVAYTVLPNITSATSRTGTLTVAGQTFTITEAGDPVPPTVSLTAPTTGTVTNTITLSATAADNIGVTRVDFYRDSGILIVSRMSSPFSTNFNTATVSDGSHCIYAKAFDAANNSASSSTNCVTVDNNAPSVPTGLTADSISASQINLNWNASVDPGTGVAGYKVFRDSAQIATTAGTSFPDSGLSGGSEHCYNVAAYDNLGHVSAVSATACAQTFTNLQSMLGSYNGLIIQTNEPMHTSSGSITLNLSNTGSFSAKLILGGVRSTFQGQLDAFGNSTNALVRKGHNSVQVTLHVDLAGSDQITGTVSDGSFTSALLAEREVYSSANPCPFAGNYSLLLGPSTTDDSTIPKGFGSGTLNIAMTGRGRLRGVLADGTKINVMAAMSKHGTWPLFNLLYKNNGALIGWATFTSNTTVGGTADWFRPALPSASLYPDGFSTNVTLIGKRYVPPAAGDPSVAGDYQLTLGGGNLASELVKNVYLYDVGNVVVMSANPENLKIKIDPVSGQLTGSFTHPSLNKNVKFTGLLLQFGNNGAGHFLGATESGFVIFVPSP